MKVNLVSIKWSTYQRPLFSHTDVPCPFVKSVENSVQNCSASRRRQQGIPKPEKTPSGHSVLHQSRIPHSAQTQRIRKSSSASVRRTVDTQMLFFTHCMHTKHLFCRMWSSKQQLWESHQEPYPDDCMSSICPRRLPIMSTTEPTYSSGTSTMASCAPEEKKQPHQLRWCT